MTFKEHNGRKKADKFAEYITGETLRRYLADKVKQYAGENVSVFDGAAGSGQLEQFINPRQLVAVEIQAEACKTLLENYPQAVVFHQSFFTYTQTEKCDCVVMNPPFSLKFKNLTEAEQHTIQDEFSWKKSGVVDDIFVLKGLTQSKRWGFFILFGGVGYRATERKFRELIGNQLVELNLISNAFEDTAIDVLFLVIDKQKTALTAKRERFDCKTQTVIVSDEWQINPEHWQNVPLPEKEKEVVDFHGLEMQCRDQLRASVIKNIGLSKMFVMLGEFSPQGFNTWCDELIDAISAEKIEIAKEH